jgi:hypothetical protein
MLFALFISPLADITTPIENYLLGSLKTEKKALEFCINETKSAMKLFLDTGLFKRKEDRSLCFSPKQFKFK